MADPQRVWGDLDINNQARSNDGGAASRDQEFEGGVPIGGVGTIMKMEILSSTQGTNSRILSQSTGTQFDAPPSSQPRPESSDEEADQEDTMMGEPERDSMVSQKLLLAELLPKNTPRTQHDLLQVKTSIQDFAHEHPFWTKSLLDEDEALEFEQDVFEFAYAAGLTFNLAKIEVMRAMGKWKAAKGLALGVTEPNDGFESSESVGVVVQSIEEVGRGNGNAKKRKRDFQVEENAGSTAGAGRSTMKRQKKRDKKKALEPNTMRAPCEEALKKDGILEIISVKPVGSAKQKEKSKKKQGPKTSSYFGQSAAIPESRLPAQKTQPSSKQSINKEPEPVVGHLADDKEEHSKDRGGPAETEQLDDSERKRRKKKRNKNRLLCSDTAAAERAARILARVDKPKELALEELSFEPTSKDGVPKNPPKKKRRTRTKRVAGADGHINLEGSGAADDIDPETKPTDIQDPIETVDEPPAKKKSRNRKKKEDAWIEQPGALVLSKPASHEGVLASTAESTGIPGQSEAMEQPAAKKSRNRKQKGDAGAEISSIPVDSEPTPSQALPTQDSRVIEEPVKKRRKGKGIKSEDKPAHVDMGGLEEQASKEPLFDLPDANSEKEKRKLKKRKRSITSQASSGGDIAVLVDQSSVVTNMQEGSVISDTWEKARSAPVANSAEDANVSSGHNGHGFVLGYYSNEHHDMPKSEEPVERLILSMRGESERETHDIVYNSSDSFIPSLPPDATQNAADAEADDSASVWSITHYGPLDWDHSGDEFEKIQVKRKITRRCSSISPRDKAKVQAAFTRAATLTKQKPEHSVRSVSKPPCVRQKRDAHGRFTPKAISPLDVLTQQKEAPILPPMPIVIKHTESRNKEGNLPASSESNQGSSATRRDANGRFAKRTVAVQAENVASDLENAGLEVEVSSTTSFNIAISAKAKRAKRAPAMSPYFSPPVTPVKLRKATKKAKAGPNPLKTPRNASLSRPQSLEKDDDSITPSQGSVRKRHSAKAVSCIPFPPLSAPHFGLIQEKLAHDPFRLLIAVTFLIRTHGKHAIPVFFELMEKYPTPEALAAAEKDDIVHIIRHLGLQNQRASTYQMYAKIWVEDPPMKDKRHPVRGYADSSVSGRNIKGGEMISDSGDRSAWEIGHMTQGPYAIDSWRIFCRDVLRGVAEGWNGEGAVEGFQPEWMRVLPEDKELRAYLRWMWLKEGFCWDPFTGEKEVAGQELMRAALEGRIAWDDEGGMRILDEVMVLEPGMSQIGANVGL
ncbi:hypothetical protein JHW43_008347 [Diplocarpon mali]|nr:hypothetical protein JHW43_008347 [Diplocarpon mali]